MLYRLLTGLGVGGAFASAVVLLAETVPDNARPFALGLFQASSVTRELHRGAHQHVPRLAPEAGRVRPPTSG